MMSVKIPWAVTTLGIALKGFAATAATITVDVDKPGVSISPMLNGLMTEEINHAYDGGLYGELIQNRSFLDDVAKPLHWTLIGRPDDGAMTLDRSSPLNDAHPLSLRIDAKGTGPVAVANDGFWGIPVQASTRYQVSFFARAETSMDVPVDVAIKSNDGARARAIGKSVITGKAWKKYSCELITSADVQPSSQNQFVLSLPAGTKGSVFFTMVSLFPPTYENRKNGLRPDLMQMMQEMRPAFLRMPGGNYLEGDDFPNRFNWKKMMGPVEERAGHMGCWGYRSSDGFGLPEFLTWCEQLKMEPLLGVFAGYTLKGDHVVAGPDLQPYVDEALQEIEYCIGGADTEWGKRRIADGHPTPFNIRYIEVGNEDQFDKTRTYEGRFAQFFDAIKAKYPHLQIIATIPVHSRRPDVIDDHFYRSPTQMAYDNTHYDKASRNGPKIFVGEWASQSGKPTPTLHAALGDAAWLMGLERNSDLVIMQAYAPLLTNVNPGAWQWPTNLIGYDALHAFGSPSYWVQVMFAHNQGDVVLPTKLKTSESLVSIVPGHGQVGLGTYHTAATYTDFSISDVDGKPLLDPETIGNNAHWQSTGGGSWQVEPSGTISQRSDQVQNPLSLIGDAGWENYTLHLKAKKLSGSEGFLILFRVADSANQVWWNIGGSNNTLNTFEITGNGSRQYMGPSTPYSVEAGRTYDLKVEVVGTRFRSFIDGQLAIDHDFKPELVKAPVFADSTYIKASNEIVLKMVNASDNAVEAAVQLAGASVVSGTGRAITLKGDSKSAQNSIEHPELIVPHEAAVNNLSEKFNYPLPPNSVTILRFMAKP